MKKSSSGAFKKVAFFLALLVARNAAKEALDVNAAKKEIAAEEIPATILFEPRKSPYSTYMYSLDTNNDMIADKRTEISYSSIGGVYDTSLNYLVRGAKIVYENKGMKNTAGEFIKPERFIAIIMEDGTYIGLEELASMNNIAWNFDYLYQKLVREGRIDSKGNIK